MSLRFLHEITEYAELGFDTLPLSPGTKRAISTDFPNRAPGEMWEHAPTDANIGLRCGGESQLCVLDADDDDAPQTSQNLTRYLASLGIYPGAYPSIATPSGGRHFYLRLDGELAGHARHYRSDFGAGEFRYGCGAYVGAPPSIIESNAYKIIGGDLRTLPRIESADVLPILKNQATTNATPTEHNTPTTTPIIPAKALQLLNGEGIEKYPSRSHAEAAVILMLVNAGFDFDAVMSLFLRYPCAGKFAERNARDPEKAISQYLFPTFASAQRKAEGRIVASSAIEWAQARVWSGRTGAIDRAVYLAHCQLAQQCGRIEYGASCRQLGEVAQVDRKTATSATNRLIDAGLLASVKRSDRYTERASVYRLGVLHNSPFPTGLENGELCNKPHDAFRARGFGKMFKARGLGKAAGLVFAELQRGEPLNVKELTERTGRDRSTVWRVLNRMARIVDNSTGEIVAMVKRDDAGKWHAVDGVDLDAIARMLGTFGGNEWQHAQHERERREHRERLNNQNDSNRDAYRTGQNRTREDDNLCQKMTRAD